MDFSRRNSCNELLFERTLAQFSMGNGFQFKQFYIQQDRCAMKVSEIACVFGAFIPISGQEATMLDVGTGTGVLSLMMAQRTKAAITALDMDEGAISDASLNIQSSPFAQRISIINDDFLQWNTKQTVDLIVCNPPFFENQLSSMAVEKQMAWHSSHLTLENLLRRSTTILADGGRIALILPIQRIPEVTSLASPLGLQPYFYYTLQHTEGHPIKYGMIGFAKQLGIPCIARCLILRNELKEYTPIVKKRLQPFYSSL